MMKHKGIASIFLLLAFVAVVGVSTAYEHHTKKPDKQAERIAELVLKDYTV